MARLALIGMNVTMQRRTAARLEQQSRHRALRSEESALLAELIRLEDERRRDAARRAVAQLERAVARVRQLGGLMA